MPKIPSRILIPILLAIICAGGLLVYIWWQITQSTTILKTQTQSMAMYSEDLFMGMQEDLAVTGDESLVHLRKGDLFALRAQWNNAQEEYEKAITSGGGVTALRKLANVQLQRRNLRGVRDTIRDLQRAGAKPEDILLLEISILLRSGELVQAKEELEQSEDSPQKYYGLSLLHIIQGNHISAKEALTHVTDGWEPVLRSYARTLQAAYDEFALFPDGSDIHLITLLSRALAQVQECELALPLLIQVTTQSETYRDAWIVQGYCELVTERPEQALASLEHAYSLDPQKPEIQYFLGRAYADTQQFENAITFLEYAVANGFQPEEDIRRLIAEYALNIDNAGLALSQYDALTTMDSADISLFEGYVTAALALGKPEEALKKAEHAIEQWPEDGKSYELLGTVALHMGDIETAKNALRKAIEINPLLSSAQKKLESIDS